MNTFCCNKGCINVGEILYDNESEYSISEIEERRQNELIKFDCYNEIYRHDFVDINYALSAYCVKIGHLNCLKILHQNGNLVWHNDLAIYALECNKINCLKYIVECMEDVEITPEIEIKLNKM